MKKVGIIGVSGYTGLELIKILLSHTSFEISYLGALTQGEISEIFPQLRGVLQMPVRVADAADAAKACDLIFLALPHEKAMEFAREILKFKSVKVVDLSADYRLSRELYEKNYTTHLDPRNLAHAVYGLPELNREKIRAARLTANPGCYPSVKVVDLSADYRLSRELYEKNYTAHLDPRNLAHAVYGLPELNREKIRAARLTANPGCYPTCSILALAPFMRLLDPALGVFIDAKSGVSGAGKALKASSHFVSVNENAGAYSPISHRHADEIKEQLQILKGGEFSTLFVPNLLPITRGMLVSAFGVLQKSVDDEIKEQLQILRGGEFSTLFVPNLLPITRGMLVSTFGVLQKSVDAEAVLREFYANEPFVRVRSEPVSIKNVVGTHFCDIFVKTAGDKIWINSAIDNLLRGASSQAVANANLMCGFAEATALPRIAHGI